MILHNLYYIYIKISRSLTLFFYISLAHAALNIATSLIKVGLCTILLHNFDQKK